MPAEWWPTRFVAVSVGLHLAVAVELVLHPAWWPWLLAGLLANHTVATIFTLWPQSQVLGPALVRLPPQAAARGEVAITFDDGPDPEVTPQVLAILAAADATASFFCICARAQRHPALVRAIATAGHSVENHTLTHTKLFACLIPPALTREIMGAQRLLGAIAGQPPRFFRAPMGFRGPPLDPVLARAGLRAACWTRRGYDTIRRNPTRVLDDLLQNLSAGDILVLHAGNAARPSAGNPVVLAVLPGLLRALQARGLKPVSLAAACAPEAWENAAAGPTSAAYASTSATSCLASSENG